MAKPEFESRLSSSCTQALPVIPHDLGASVPGQFPSALLLMSVCLGSGSGLKVGHILPLT